MLKLFVISALDEMSQTMHMSLTYKPNFLSQGCARFAANAARGKEASVNRQKTPPGPKQLEQLIQSGSRGAAGKEPSEPWTGSSPGDIQQSKVLSRIHPTMSPCCWFPLGQQQVNLVLRRELLAQWWAWRGRRNTQLQSSVWPEVSRLKQGLSHACLVHDVLGS